MRSFQLVLVASTLSGVAVLAAAAERATFVLTDGERVSGTVVVYTEERTNMEPLGWTAPSMDGNCSCCAMESRDEVVSSI